MNNLIPYVINWYNKKVIMNNKLSLIMIVSILFITLLFILNTKNKNKESRLLSNKTSVNQEKYDKLNKLATQVQIDYFTKLLSDPVFINKSEDKAYIEYIYVNENYYVQAITDDNKKVLAFTVVSRKKDFNPILDYFGGEYTLLKSSLADVRKNGSPENCYLNIPASGPFSYYEDYYYGRPGLYQTYRVGIAQAGYFNQENSKIDFTKLIEIRNKSTNPEGIDCSLLDSNFLDNMYINAVMVIDEVLQDKKLPFDFGPLSDQVSRLK